MARYDDNAVRDAAKGRWREILPAVTGIDGELLDGDHHPCPKCSEGKDRFRMIDSDAGALLCNQCFSKGNGDGFAAIMWLTGCKFPEALEKVAEVVGVRPKGSKDPARDLEFRPWSGALVPIFASKRKGVTEESLVAAGARLARYKNFTVFALPIIGETLDTEKPVGWVLMNATGGRLPKYNKKGEHIGDVKVKITYGSKPGLVGKKAVERLKLEGLPEVIWKVEGVTDLLALTAKIPGPMSDRHLVVTNANGAGEEPKWMAGILSRARPLVLHDADQPGEAGAKLWTKEIARQGTPCGLVRLPYEVADTSGKDVRDWLGEGNTYDDLLSLANSADMCRPTGDGDAEEGDAADFPIQELILSRLGLEVIREDANGSVRVFSTKLRKSTTFDRVAKISKVELIQAAGVAASRCIAMEPDNQNTFAMDDVREAIALIGSSRRGRDDERGVGLWRGIADDGSHANAIILSNDNEAARWNGDRIMRRVSHPRVEGLVLDFGDGEHRWYEHETLERYVNKASASAEWREDAIMEAVELFQKWNWRGQHAPELVTGLVMATWLQTIWAWRPLVMVIGESNCGKSTLFETLAGKQGSMGLFGGLAMAGAKSSEAGIRQGVGNSGRIILLDEFEKSKERDRILETLRASSRGDTVMKGTAGHKGVSFKLQHIPWLAAIESGLSRQPDVNRFVQLELLKAEKGKSGQLLAPEGHEAVALGQKLLAASLVVGLQSRELAIRMKSLPVEGADSRLIETYAVPAAVLGLALGYEEEACGELLTKILSDVVAQGADPVQPDHEMLFEQLMESTVRCDHGKQMAVSKLYESWREGGTEYHGNLGALELHGLAFKWQGSEALLVVRKDLVLKNLLPNSEWRGSRIDQVLLRLGGADRRTVRLNGKPSRCVAIPIPSGYDESGP